VLVGAQVGPEEYHANLARDGGDLCRCGRRPVAIIAHHGSGHGNYLGRHCSVCLETSYRADPEYVWAGGEWVVLSSVYGSGRLDTNLTYLLWSTMRHELPERTPPWDEAWARWDSIRREPSGLTHDHVVRLAIRNLGDRPIWALCVLNPGLTRRDAALYLARSPGGGVHFLDVLDGGLPPQEESAPSIGDLRAEAAEFQHELSLVPQPMSGDLFEGEGFRFHAFTTREAHLELCAVSARELPYGWGPSRDRWHVAFDGTCTPQGDVDPDAVRALAGWTQQHDLVAAAIRRHCSHALFSAHLALLDEESLGESEAWELLRQVRVGRALVAAADLPAERRNGPLFFALSTERSSARLAGVARGRRPPAEAMSMVPSPQTIRRMAAEGPSAGGSASLATSVVAAGPTPGSAGPMAATVLPSWPEHRRRTTWCRGGWRSRATRPR
jgi:hypothetical protein